jgi:hypothetical protein
VQCQLLQRPHVTIFILCIVGDVAAAKLAPTEVCSMVTTRGQHALSMSRKNQQQCEHKT